MFFTFSIFPNGHLSSNGVAQDLQMEAKLPKENFETPSNLRHLILFVTIPSMLKQGISTSTSSFFSFFGLLYLQLGLQILLNFPEFSSLQTTSIFINCQTFSTFSTFKVQLLSKFLKFLKFDFLIFHYSQLFQIQFSRGSIFLTFSNLFCPTS